LQDIINKYGGKLSDLGVPVEEIQLRYQERRRKINVDPTVGGHHRRDPQVFFEKPEESIRAAT